MKEIEYKNHIIRIEQSEYLENPNFNTDLWQLVFTHSQFYPKHRVGYDSTDIIRSKEDYQNLYEKLLKDWWGYEISAYIHSEISISLGRKNGWDISNRGMLLINRKEFPTIEEANKAAEAAISYWNKYLMGDFYDYKIFSKCGECGSLEEEDGCTEFESEEEAIDEAKAVIDGYFPMMSMKQLLERANEKYDRNPFTRMTKLQEENLELATAALDYAKHLSKDDKTWTKVPDNIRQHLVDELGDVWYVLEDVMQTFGVTKEELLISLTDKHTKRETDPTYKKGHETT